MLGALQVGDGVVSDGVGPEPVEGARWLCSRCGEQIFCRVFDGGESVVWLHEDIPPFFHVAECAPYGPRWARLVPGGVVLSSEAVRLLGSATTEEFALWLRESTWRPEGLADDPQYVGRWADPERPGEEENGNGRV